MIVRCCALAGAATSGMRQQIARHLAPPHSVQRCRCEPTIVPPPAALRRRTLWPAALHVATGRGATPVIYIMGQSSYSLIDRGDTRETLLGLGSQCRLRETIEQLNRGAR